MNNLYDMKLHEFVKIDNKLTVMRVPGGWIYNRFGWDDGDVLRTSTFVPLNNEFQGK
jgi:hypothetical protein